MATKKIISLFLILVMFGGLATPVVAKAEGYDSENCSDITLERIVEVEIAKDGKAILNVTEVNKSLSEWIAEKFSESSCQDRSCLVFDYKVEMKEIYNYSTKGKQLTFSEVKVYNSTASFEFKVLSYFAETATYNLSLVTRIMQIEGENYFVTAINVAPKDEKKFAPFADVIEIKSKVKLSEHYRILAEVLNEIRKQDETSWIWNKAKLELSYLSRAVERNLAEFNVEGRGSIMVLDIDWNSLLCDACKWLVGGICEEGTTLGCALLCGRLCLKIPHPIGAGACWFICTVACDFIVKYKGCSMSAEEVCRRVNVCK